MFQPAAVNQTAANSIDTGAAGAKVPAAFLLSKKFHLFFMPLLQTKPSISVILSNMDEIVYICWPPALPFGGEREERP